MITKGTLKILIPSFAILTALIFLMSPVQAAQQSASPLVATSVNYQPNPSLNANVTWSTFNSSMSWNEYLNSTGHPGYINAEPSISYKNYISINPSDIIAPKILQNDTLGKSNINWGATNTTAPSSTPTNITDSLQYKTIGGVPEVTLYANATSTHGAGVVDATFPIEAPDYPSQNLQYDYLTAIFSVNIPASSGAIGQIFVNNATAYGYITPQVTSGTYYITENLLQFEKSINYAETFNTTAGDGYSAKLFIGPQLNIPSGAPAGTYSITLNALAFTRYPITFGSNASGTITQNAGNLQLSVFHPDINNVSIVNGGYSEALSQELSNINYTATQTPISSGNYIEQVGYQGTFSFPSEPDLTYTGANFTLPLSVPGSQFQALDVNGVSYLSNIGNKTNGTVVLLSSPNPTSSTSYLAYIDFTASQWQTISSPPGFFSIAGIEYYWFIAIGAIASLLGLAGAVRHAHTKADQTERVSRMGPRR
jgi:hypothetical protein